MKVSIITPTYNSAATIKDTLKCINEQTYKNIEHIVIDGLSKDNTVELVKEFSPNSIIVSEKDDGLFYGMNKGVGMATGEITGILNSDDFYCSNQVIEKVVDAIKTNNADSVYGDLKLVNEVNTDKVVRSWISGDYDREKFLYGWMPPHPTFFVKTELYEKFGNFDTSFRISGDYELMLRFLYVNSASSCYINEFLVHQRDGGNSNSSFKTKLDGNNEDYRAWIRNNIKPKYFTRYLKPLRKIDQFFRS